MKKKHYKIKRYSNIYGPNTGNRRPLKIIFTIAAIVLCCFLGWALYMPTYEFLMNMGEEKEPKNITSSSQSPSSEENSVESDVSEVPTISSTVDETESKGGVFAPISVLSDTAQLESFVDSVKQKGCTSIVVDAKSASGEVLFMSENEVAIKSMAIVGNAFDAKIVADVIKNNGLVPVARIHAFRDGISATANNDMAVKYYDTNYIWLDNSSQLGGRGWLNPYSDKATDYIGKLAQELIKDGFEEVIIESLQYPQGVGREKMGFGAASVDKSQQLENCMSDIRKSVEEFGGKASFVIGSKDYNNDGEMLYGGDLLNFKDYSLTFTSSIEDVELTKQLVTTLSNEGSSAGVILLSYNSDGSQANEEKVRTIFQELEKMNVKKIYLYNPQGIY